MKVAPILRAAAAVGELQCRLVHTGQHYDERMSDLFFRDLGLPVPDAFLGVGSGSHAAQTATVMLRFDEELDANPADMVLVVGDVNSTLACALVASKRGIRVAHVEAGLRSGDRTMPEEINRVLTDQISDLLFTSERDAEKNLRAEGIDAARIHFVGNVMIDSLVQHRDRARRCSPIGQLGVESRGYAVCTMHRPSNVDSEAAAAKTLEAIEVLARRLPVVFPLHPRTAARWDAFGLLQRVKGNERIRVTPPLGYLEFLAVMDSAAVVLTDSGGIQEETTVLGVPCLTFRENTERPTTIAEGTNQLVGTDVGRVSAALDKALGNHSAAARVPALWDGKAAERIVAVLRAVALAAPQSAIA
jgi:UDP-N-acetylglucosamine 2-epimerase (non-hydrolysing)